MIHPTPAHPPLLPWVPPEQRRLIHLRGRVRCFELDPSMEGIAVPDEPCVTCSIVHWCDTPATIDPLYTLTTLIRSEWKRLTMQFNANHPDFPLRQIDITLVLAMLVAGELGQVDADVIPHDCADLADYFCRYVRLMQRTG